MICKRFNENNLTKKNFKWVYHKNAKIKKARVADMTSYVLTKENSIQCMFNKTEFNSEQNINGYALTKQNSIQKCNRKQESNCILVDKSSLLK